MELVILSTLENRTRHGYEIGKLLEERSHGGLEFRVSTLYTALYRMEERGWIAGRWVEKAGERRRCYYTFLASQKKEWVAFSSMVNQVIGVSHA
jgi:DNA-binding PadR family transcriptional regulator